MDYTIIVAHSMWGWKVVPPPGGPGMVRAAAEKTVLSRFAKLPGPSRIHVGMGLPRVGMGQPNMNIT